MEQIHNRCRPPVTIRVPSAFQTDTLPFELERHLGGAISDRPGINPVHWLREPPTRRSVARHEIVVPPHASQVLETRPSLAHLAHMGRGIEGTGPFTIPGAASPY